MENVAANETEFYPRLTAELAVQLSVAYSHLKQAHATGSLRINFIISWNTVAFDELCCILESAV
jgi:hypothetical protein